MSESGAVLVTGAAGFVGRHLCRALVDGGWPVRAAVRTADSAPALQAMGCDVVEVGDIGPQTDWSSALSGVHRVAHLAARVHIMSGPGRDDEAAFQRVNVDGTAQLARSAAAAGVTRLVYLSSIKVNGDGTTSLGRAYREDDAPAPCDAYGRSKWEAEQALAHIAVASSLETVVLRPPLVYGPGVGANFRALLQAVARGTPLPLGAVRNARSLVYVGNLVDAVVLCLAHPAAAGRTYLVSDGEDLSTADLVRRVAAAMQRPARLLPVPPALLHLAGRLTGRGAAVERLCGSLQVEAGRLRRELGWRPPFAVDQGIARTVAAFQNGGDLKSSDG